MLNVMGTLGSKHHGMYQSDKRETQKVKATLMICTLQASGQLGMHNNSGLRADNYTSIIDVPKGTGAMLIKVQSPTKINKI